MQKMKLTTLLLCALSALILPSFVLAANSPADAELLEEVQPPPKITEGEALEDGTEEPQVTIRKKVQKRLRNIALMAKCI